ncbi:MAG: hypothetical protein CM15mP74_36310 [Halieaceae bacterium]|nr:MAG: hypothetical protein CM15mP74_36310 [Halieaceae bacterium]
MLFATGRRPNIAISDLSTRRRLTEQGYLSVDDNFQTDEPSIYALGDMTGGWELTPVAIGEAMAFAQTSSPDSPPRWNMTAYPRLYLANRRSARWA